jgi:hypothetical protein
LHLAPQQILLPSQDHSWFFATQHLQPHRHWIMLARFIEPICSAGADSNQ